MSASTKKEHHEIVHINPAWNSLLSPQLLERLDQTTFLSRCRTKEISRKELEVFLIQQHHYSKNFTRFLCALISRLGGEADRNSLVHNLFEEMGLGDLGDEPHSKIYRDMLTALDLDPSVQLPLPETEALTSTMLKLCSDPNPMVGLGALCLGSEAIVPHIYSQIMAALVSQGVPEKHLRFFPLHIDGDDDHALTMKTIIDHELKKNPRVKQDLLRGAEESIRHRAAFFEAISQSVPPKGQREAPKHVTREEAPPATFSSKDFALTRAEIKVQVPERLFHGNVRDQFHSSFSQERRHGVAIVDLPSKTISVTVGHLHVGQGTRLHRHNYETILYIVKGEGYTVVEDKKIPWKVGDAVYVPVWAWHQHINTGSGEAEYLACENTPLLQNLGNVAMREEAS